MESSKGSLNWVIAAGIVGADIGTSVFYGTGILFPIVGYLAPVFVLTTCLMMWVFKKTYEEGLALSPYNGGAYSMILRTLGRQFAVLAGALTVVSYLATAAVSSLSGAFYLSSLFSGMTETTVVLFSFVPIILFGLLNTRGIKEPAKIVTGIAGFHFVLLIIITLLGLGYLGLHFNEINWTKFSNPFPGNKEITIAALMYGFAAGFLGITGFESAAQIVEELEEPVLHTVKKLYKTVIILVSLTAPAISFLCLALLTDQEVNENKEYLLSALSFKIGGRFLLTIIVIDATLTLFAATNTAFVGFIGLATTMAKQGNLPPMLLNRVSHKWQSIQGYPLIALPFMVVAMLMCAFVSGEIDIVAKVYEIAFLGVMVSFCLGVMLMRNKPLRRDIDKNFLTNWLIMAGPNRKIPITPLLSGFVLFFAQATLVFSSGQDARSMLVQLLSIIIFIMAFYRWGMLENRLETRSDLRLGLGKYYQKRNLPETLPKHILCAGGTGARRLILKAIRTLKKEYVDDPFELVIFHAENNQDSEGFFYELLQRVVSQQVVPVYQKSNFIIRVKILPGSLIEGLQTLKKSITIDQVMLGGPAKSEAVQEIIQQIEHDLEAEVQVI